jgi:hypothetical protein
MQEEQVEKDKEEEKVEDWRGVGEEEVEDRREQEEEEEKVEEEDRRGE